MELEVLDKELKEIFIELTQKEEAIDEITKDIHPEYRLSAKNLIRYLIVRSHNLSKYHTTLTDLGLSSMRNAEAYVYSDFQNVIRNLSLIQGTPVNIAKTVETIGYSGSRKLLRNHSRRLFSKTKKDPFTEIMVTLPEEAAEDKEMVWKMVNSGMQIARINLGRGSLDQWKKMVNIISQIRDETGKKVKIYMDLPGPKIRTSPIRLASKKGNIKDAIRVKKGDEIVLTRDIQSQVTAKEGSGNETLQRARIGVTLGELIDQAKIGDPVYFDDGTIKAHVIAKEKEELVLEIIRSYKSKIGYHKGINLPNTELHLPALTEKDKSFLPFVCKNADIVGYSFVRTGKDVEVLYKELSKYECQDIGVVFKIETKDAFENLPDIILQGMRRHKIGVMIARGDLAVEIGFEQISEVQNQILGICEAAHIPAIWATQVLENLAKKGMPTRAEISDAALSAQVECVMLNKGPKIVLAIKVLRKILKRRQKQSFKKKNELRPLQVAQNYVYKTFRMRQASLSR